MGWGFSQSLRHDELDRGEAQSTLEGCHQIVPQPALLAS